MVRSRIRFVALFVLLLTLLGGGHPTAAQEATPTGADAAFADLGLPELTVTITETAFEGIPSELAAGRYVLRVTNALEPVEGPFGPEINGVGLLQLPEELSADDFLALVAPPVGTPAEAMPAASPAPAEEAGEEAGGTGPPPWYYTTRLAGGPYALPGQTVTAVVDLTAGEWILWGESPGAPQQPVVIAVTGEVPADVPAPTASVTVEMADHAFRFPATLSAGPQVIELINVGEQPHFLELSRVPEGTTVEDALALFEAFEAMAADPQATPAGSLTPDELEGVLSTADQSAGVTAWYTADLAPGTYLAICFVPDQESGVPHALLGMTQIIEVE
jgi:hypothetical protein